MVFKPTDRIIEFSNPKQHVGWRNGKPVFAVFSMDMARALFEEFISVTPIAICVAPPHAAVVENYEQAVHFFSDDDVNEATTNARVNSYWTT